MPISILIAVFISCSTIFDLTTRDLGEKRTLNTCLPPRPRILSSGLFEIGAIKSTSIPIYAGEQNFYLRFLRLALRDALRDALRFLRLALRDALRFLRLALRFLRAPPVEGELVGRGE